MDSGWKRRFDGCGSNVEMSDERFSAMDEGSLRKLVSAVPALSSERAAVYTAGCPLPSARISSSVIFPVGGLTSLSVTVESSV